MGVRYDYGYAIQKGVAGGIFDLSLKNIFTFTIDEGNEIVPGMGVVSGITKGETVKLPDDSSTAGDFEGVFVHGSKQLENTRDGKVSASGNDPIGVMQKGRIWVAIAPDTTVTAKAKVYLVISGDNAGCFANVENATESNKIELTATFTGVADTDNNIAVIEY